MVFTVMTDYVRCLTSESSDTLDKSEPNWRYSFVLMAKPEARLTGNMGVYPHIRMNNRNAKKKVSIQEF